MVASEPLDHYTWDDSLSWKLIEKNVIMSFEPRGVRDGIGEIERAWR